MSQGQASIPSQPRAKQLRACLLCSIIQTPADFRKYGCPNCEEIMQVGTANRQRSTQMDLFAQYANR